MQRFKIYLAAISAITVLAAPASQAQTSYPNKPIRILTGSSPGAPSDLVARLLAEKLANQFKQPVVVENRAGANNGLAAQQVARAAPDGYTLLVTPDTAITVNPLVFTKMDFDPRTDLNPISLLASFNQIMVCNSSLKINTVKELVERAKQSDLTYASGGPGSPGNLAAELFLHGAGITMTHIPYKGPSPALTDVMGGQVDCGFLTTPTVLPHVKTGRLTALAVSSSTPSPMAPTVPTLPQVGLPDIDASFNQYLMAPTGTPQTVLDTLQKAVQEALKEQDMRDRLMLLDLTPAGSTPEQARTRLKQDTEKWGAVVKRMDLHPN
ncbi:MAG TPA: tripartite tricarboxylate transporter substrate binding protein [Eoetvoesiella sp.]